MHRNQTRSQSTSPKHFFSTVRRYPRGSSPGPSGWRFEHIRLLLDNLITCDGMFSACSAIAEGSLPPSIADLLSAARLIALPKSSGDVRPISIGEVFRRVTAKTICLQLKENFSTYFTPIQHGVATEGGSELLANHIRLLMEVNKDWALLKTSSKCLQFH